MPPLETVIENGHGDAFAGEAACPGPFHVHVETLAGSLVLVVQRRKNTCTVQYIY